jgi:hypothetical protein
MACLNLDPGYPTHIKTVRLIALLGHDADVLPMRLWFHCGMHHPETGELEGYTSREIELIIRWRGKRGAAVRALLKTGFLDRSPKGYRVHNWLRHQGHIAVLKRRSLKANEVRWRKIDPVDTAVAEDGTSSSPRTKTRNPKRKRRSPPSLPSLPSLPVQQDNLPPPHPPLPARERAKEEMVEAAAANGEHAEKPENVDDERPAQPVAAVPGNSLEKIIRDRIGWGRHLSRMDLQKVDELKEKHGTQFYSACDRLHGGVRHLTAYLQAILEPQDRTTLLSLQVKQMVDRMGIQYDT